MVNFFLKLIPLLIILIIFQNCTRYSPLGFNKFELIERQTSSKLDIVRNIIDIKNKTIIIPASNFSPVFKRTHYDYVPTVMIDGKYKMWWCGGVAGDHIFYSESEKPNGDWTTPTIVLYPRYGKAVFDGLHVCDPSVIRVGQTYYMYYGGAETGQSFTKIGVAESADGINWTRMNSGNPIIVPSMKQNPILATYGVGQPSVVYHLGYFYISFLDSTGAAVNPRNGAGQFLWRSKDPTFSSPEVLTSRGFESATDSNQTEYSYIEAFSIDMMFSDMIQKFIIAKQPYPDPESTTIIAFDKDTFQQSGEVMQISLPNTHDGPGLAHRPDGHAPASTVAGHIHLDIFSGAGGSDNDPNTWDIYHSGSDLFYKIDPKIVNWASVFQGYNIYSPGLPLTYITNGYRLQIAKAEVGRMLSNNYSKVDSNLFYKIPYGASLHSGVEIISTQSQPAAFLLDDGKKWPIGCLEMVTRNNSKITQIAMSAYFEYKIGGELFCVNRY